MDIIKICFKNFCFFFVCGLLISKDFIIIFNLICFVNGEGLNLLGLGVLIDELYCYL